MVSEKIKLSQNVMLIDASFLNFVVADLRKYFEQMLKRPLQEIDLTELSTYLALDAGISEGANEIQMLMVYDKESSTLQYCHPANLKGELNGVAFKNQVGEFAFAGVPCEEMVSRADLYIDLLGIVADCGDVKKLVVVSFNEEYGQEVTAALNKVEGKEIVQFRMDEPEEVLAYQWEMLAFPVMQALGIKGDEL